MDISEKKINFTSLEKEIFSGEGITKYDLIQYYLRISPYMLPHLDNRFLVFQRFPDGTASPGFFQKNRPQGTPSWIKSLPFQHSSKKTTYYLMASDPETLAWLGNQACLEIHPWLCSASKPDTPDFAVFDLDPPGSHFFQQVCQVAAALKAILDRYGLRAYPKASGSRGIQVFLPLKPLYSFKLIQKFTAAIFEELHRELPELTSLKRNIAKRGEKIYLDYLQNARGKTIVAVYSPRPLSGAPVSTPLQWSEIQKLPATPDLLTCNIVNIFSRLEEKGELFAPVLHDRQEINMVNSSG